MRRALWGLCGVVLAATAAAAETEIRAQSADPPKPKVHVESKIAETDRPEWAGTAISRMHQILSELIDHLETARTERDVMLLNCINEKLTAVKGLLKISEQSNVTLQEAVARRDADAAGHEFDKIRIALGKSEELSAAAQACVGELAVYAGETVVDVEQTGVPGEDPTEQDGEEFVVTRPPAASPFQ